MTDIKTDVLDYINKHNITATTQQVADIVSHLTKLRNKGHNVGADTYIFQVLVEDYTGLNRVFG